MTSVLRRVLGLACSVVVFAWSADVGAQDPVGRFGELVWRGAQPFDPVLGVPEVDQALRAGPDRELWIVQFRGVPTESGRARLRAAGAELFWYIPDHAYTVRMPAGVAAEVAGLPDVRWVGRFEPAWRLQPDLVTAALRGGPEPERLCALMVDRSGDLAPLRAAVAGLGGAVIGSDPDGGPLVELILPARQLAQLASLDQILWVERWTPVGTDMDNARIQGGGNYIEAAGGYSGQGVIGHVHEGVEDVHPDFTHQPQAVLSPNIPDSHGHATAGIVFGNGTSNPAVRGMAPDAQFFFTNYSAQSVPITTRGPVFRAIRNFEASFTTASWGNSRTLYYTAVSVDSDQAIFDNDMVWTQSQSNAGNQSSRPQAWAKNVMSIGGVAHYDDSDPNNDSWRGGSASTGPAADGRIKPDLCAYYDRIGTSDRSGSAGYSSGNWTPNFGGTSGATPIVAGHNALAIQMFTDGVFGNRLRNPGGSRFSNRPHSTTLKALMIAAAKQYTFTASSSDNRREHQGWGFPDLRAMYDDRARFLIVDETEVISQGQTARHTLRVAAGEPLLKVVLTWSDPPGVPNEPSGSSVLVNDLDLRVIDPSGATTWLGNVGLATGMWSQSGGQPDRRDSVECVFVQNPVAGDWTIEVVATRIAQDGHTQTGAIDADYGLVARGGVDPNPGGGGGGNCRVVYSDDDQPGSGSCNFVPFGTTRSTALANQLYQTLVPVGRLGAAGKISSLAFASCGSGLRHHDEIRIRMSHVPPGYTMQPTFAQNMPTPLTVLAARDWSWHHESGQWSPIGLMAPFVYDGSSDLVIEIELRGSHFEGSPNDMRSAGRPRLAAFGWTSGPPATGMLTTGGAVKMRLGFECAGIVRLGVPCAALSMTSAGSPQLGGSFDVGVTAGLPSKPVFLNFGYDNRPPIFPLDMAFLGVPGCKIWHDALAVLSIHTDARGDSSISIAVPNLPVIAGASMYAQALQTDSSLPGGAVTSDYLRCVFGL